MHEKSPFTFSDFFKQRKRWMQGIYMVVASPRISWRTKGLLAMSLSAWLTLPLSTLNIVLSQAFPFTLGFALDFGLALLGAMGLLCYGFGYVKQHHIRR
jgi:egghead protein (zeste-white 4 protein)